MRACFLGLAVFLAALCRGAAGAFVFPSVTVRGRPPDIDACTNFTLLRGTPPDVELGPAEFAKGLLNWGDITLFAPVHEKLKNGKSSPMHNEKRLYPLVSAAPLPTRLLSLLQGSAFGSS